MIKDSEKLLREALKGSTFENVHIKDTVSSTMDWAKEYAFDEDYNRHVFIALNQTDGRGTNGRSFLSDEGGVYMSILFIGEDFSNTLFTLKAAVAVAHAVKNICGIDVKLKWVNDVYYDDKKICGILAKSAYMGNIPAYTILGIGLNVNQEDFGDIDAASLYMITDRKFDTLQVMKELVIGFEKVLTEENNRQIIDFYEKNCINIGLKCEVIIDGEKCIGDITGIGKNGELKVKIEDKTILIRSRNELLN